MNQSEINQVKTWMRRLARITSEINEIAFQMADFEGFDEKTRGDAFPDLPDDAPTEGPTQYVPTVVRTSATRTAVKNSKVSKLEYSDLSTMSTAAKIEYWHGQVSALSDAILKARTHEEAQKLARTRAIYSGHIKKNTNKSTKESDAWKSKAK